MSIKSLDCLPGRFILRAALSLSLSWAQSDNSALPASEPLPGDVSSVLPGFPGLNINWAFNLNPGTPSAPIPPHPFESDQGWGGSR